MTPESNWLARARDEYRRQPDTHVRLETNFSRANQAIKVLQEKVVPVNNSPSILLVGIGSRGGYENPLVCSYSPFVISAYLESKGVDYKMTLVDISDAIISDIKTRNNIYLSSEYISEFLDGEENWKRYLDWTKQGERVLREKEDGLVFGYTDNLFPPEFHLEQGIHAAKVPLSFKTKLQTGDIVLIEDDIAVADLGNRGYDFVECTNVLYHLPKDGQMLAIVNIASSVNEGGLVLINDIGKLANNPLFTELGGWLNKHMLEQVGLEIDEITTHENEIEEPRGFYRVNTIWATLRKVRA